MIAKSEIAMQCEEIALYLELGIGGGLHNSVRVSEHVGHDAAQRSHRRNRGAGSVVPEA
jgi:hypothetical protein